MMFTSTKFQLPEDVQPTIEELPGDLSALAEVIEQVVPGHGVATVLAIVERFRGTYVYCHNVDGIYRKARNRYIRKKYDEGVTVPEIAREVGLGERRIWDVLKEPQTVNNGQLSLF